nr:hypothetical protein [Kibdelosporangium sp. MJ126-NF4]
MTVTFRPTRVIPSLDNTAADQHGVTEQVVSVMTGGGPVYQRAMV